MPAVGATVYDLTKPPDPSLSLNIPGLFRSLLLPSTRVHLVPPESPKHPLKDMPHFQLEVILVIVGPSKESGNKLLQMWSDEVDGEGVDSKLDEAQNGFDDFAVV